MIFQYSTKKIVQPYAIRTSADCVCGWLPLASHFGTIHIGLQRITKESQSYLPNQTYSSYCNYIYLLIDKITVPI